MPITKGREGQSTGKIACFVFVALLGPNLSSCATKAEGKRGEVGLASGDLVLERSSPHTSRPDLGDDFLELDCSSPSIEGEFPAISLSSRRCFLEALGDCRGARLVEGEHFIEWGGWIVLTKRVVPRQGSCILEIETVNLSCGPPHFENGVLRHTCPKLPEREVVTVSDFLVNLIDLEVDRGRGHPPVHTTVPFPIGAEEWPCPSEIVQEGPLDAWARRCVTKALSTCSPLSVRYSYVYPETYRNRVRHEIVPSMDGCQVVLEVELDWESYRVVCTTVWVDLGNRADQPVLDFVGKEGCALVSANSE